MKRCEFLKGAALDRAVTVGGVPTLQFKAGSLQKPEQFVVVDHTSPTLTWRCKRTLPDTAIGFTGSSIIGNC
jgi:peptide/nickel transport system substrate-binding protein